MKTEVCKIMNSNLKFLLSLGNVKLVMLSRQGKNAFYMKEQPTPTVKPTPLKRIICTLSVR
jgi:hypothetical protein